MRCDRAGRMQLASGPLAGHPALRIFLARRESGDGVQCPLSQQGPLG